MHTARIPPVDPAPASTDAVLAMYAGQILPSSALLIILPLKLMFYCSNGGFPRAKGLNSSLQAGVAVAPALRHLPVIFADQPQSRVTEFDECSALYFTQAVLQVVGDRVGHNKWPADFQQCW